MSSPDKPSNAENGDPYETICQWNLKCVELAEQNEAMLALLRELAGRFECADCRFVAEHRPDCRLNALLKRLP